MLAGTGSNTVTLGFLFYITFVFFLLTNIRLDVCFQHITIQFPFESFLSKRFSD